MKRYEFTRQPRHAGEAPRKVTWYLSWDAVDVAEVVRYENRPDTEIALRTAFGAIAVPPEIVGEIQAELESIVWQGGM